MCVVRRGACYNICFCLKGSCGIGVTPFRFSVFTRQLCHMRFQAHVVLYYVDLRLFKRQLRYSILFYQGQSNVAFEHSPSFVSSDRCVTVVVVSYVPAAVLLHYMSLQVSSER